MGSIFYRPFLFLKLFPITVLVLIVTLEASSLTFSQETSRRAVVDT